MNSRFLIFSSTLQKLLFSTALLGATFLQRIDVKASNILDYAANIAAPRADFDVVNILARIALLILLITIYWIVLNRIRKSQPF